jgi:hypothetical protein
MTEIRRTWVLCDDSSALSIKSCLQYNLQCKGTEFRKLSIFNWLKLYVSRSYGDYWSFRKITFYLTILPYSYTRENFLFISSDLFETREWFPSLSCNLTWFPLYENKIYKDHNIVPKRQEPVEWTYATNIDYMCVYQMARVWGIYHPFLYWNNLLSWTLVWQLDKLKKIKIMDNMCYYLFYHL